MPLFFTLSSSSLFASSSSWKIKKAYYRYLHASFGLSLLHLNHGGVLFIASTVFSMIHRYFSQNENAISKDKRSLSHCKFANKSTPKTLCLDDQHVSHSQLERCIADVQNLVQLDEGNRGIAGILPCGTVGSLLKAAECMDESQSVAIITGFPCMIDYVPPTETDGPLGALSLARTLLYLGKDVVILTDECNEEVLLACGAASGLMSHHTSSNNNNDSTSDGADSIGYTNKKVLKMESFPSKNDMDEREMHRLMSIAASVDLVIAIERAGPNFEGKYLTMRYLQEMI